MARSQSPGYPNIPLDQALIKARAIFDKDRTNIIDREVAAVHIGYSGQSGASDKALSTLSHYDLLEKAGKGQAKLTDVAMRIFAPVDDEERKFAVHEAGNAPTIFARINEHFETEPSESALKNWLIREEFNNSAIKHVIKAYVGTMAFLKQEGASESSSPSMTDDANLQDEMNGDTPVTEQLMKKMPDNVLPITLEENAMSIRIEADKLSLNCQNVTASGLKVLLKKLEKVQQILELTSDLNSLDVVEEGKDQRKVMPGMEEP